MEKCPFCAGDVPEEAVVCVHCQRALTEAPAGLPEVRTDETVSAAFKSAMSATRPAGGGVKNEVEATDKPPTAPVEQTGSTVTHKGAILAVA